MSGWAGSPKRALATPLPTQPLSPPHSITCASSQAGKGQSLHLRPHPAPGVKAAGDGDTGSGAQHTSCPKLAGDDKPSDADSKGGNAFLDILKNPLWVDGFGNHYHIPLDLKSDQNLQGKKKSNIRYRASSESELSTFPDGSRYIVQ